MEITCVDTKSSSPKAQDKENIKLGKKYVYIFFIFYYRTTLLGFLSSYKVKLF